MWVKKYGVGNERERKRGQERERAKQTKKNKERNRKALGHEEGQINVRGKNIVEY